MADESSNLTVPKQEAGAVFRLEMWATNVMLGYWWVIALAIVLFLGAVGVYYVYKDSISNGQKTTATQSYMVVDELLGEVIDQTKIDELQAQQGIQIRVTPAIDGMEMRFPPIVRIPLEAGLSEFGAEVDDRDARLVEAGDALKAIAQSSSGVASGEAWLMASEMYALGNNDEASKEALGFAASSEVPPVRYAADARLASADRAAGNMDAVDARLRPWIKEESGFMGQRAALDLAKAYHSAGRASDARTVLTEMQSTWPASPLNDSAQDLQDKLGSGAGGAAPTEAPTDGAAPTEAPTDGAAPTEAPTDGAAPADGAPSEEGSG